MIGEKIDFQPRREHAVARAASSGESLASPARADVVEIRKAPHGAGAWDPYEVWLTRVKRPRDARDRDAK